MSELLQNDKSNGQTIEDNKNLSDPDVPGDYKESTEDPTAGQCKHPSHLQINTAAIIELLPPEYWATYGQGKTDTETDDVCNTDQANRAINQAFITRLEELEGRAPDALEAKLETYKEWVSVLQRLNKMLLCDFDDFERTIEDHLKMHESRTNCNYKRDVTSLVKFIRQAFHFNNWSLAGFEFETMTPAYVMGLDEQKPNDMEILAKLLKGEYQPQKDQNGVRKKLSSNDMNLKALVEEVAGKHDEINKLKQQLCCLEEEVQNAQKKIQLKDDVIRELRLDLKNLTKSLVNDTKTIQEMAPIQTGSATELVAKSPRLSNNLMRKMNANDPKVLAENLEYLRNQLQEILATSGWRSSKNDAERLQEIFLKLEADKSDACTRLKQIKEHLLDIVTLDQHEVQNLILNDNDEMLIRAIRDHIDSINLSHKELSHQVQQFLIEKAEAAGKMEALNNMNRINCDALKELADLLSSLTNEAFNYNEIYNSSLQYNPFCEAICNIKDNFSKTIENLTSQLAAEKAKYRKSEKEMGMLEKTNDGTSNTKLSRISYTSRTQQTTTSQRSYTSVLTPHPRHKSKSPEGKH